MTERQTFTAYITKYALTGGISTRTVEGTAFPTMVTWKTPTGFIAHAHLPDWHRDLVGARAQAEKMRKAKIASLQKSIAKLEKLSFADLGDAQ